MLIETIPLPALIRRVPFIPFQLALSSTSLKNGDTSSNAPFSCFLSFSLPAEMRPFIQLKCIPCKGKGFTYWLWGRWVAWNEWGRLQGFVRTKERGRARDECQVRNNSFCLFLGSKLWGRRVLLALQDASPQHIPCSWYRCKDSRGRARSGISLYAVALF